jgi:hypothetical protein
MPRRPKAQADGVTKDDLRALSLAVFTSRNFLAVCLPFRASETEIFDLKQVEEMSGLSGSSVLKELRVLVRIGAIARIEAARSVGYQKVDGVFWHWYEELISIAIAEGR